VPVVERGSRVPPWFSDVTSLVRIVETINAGQLVATFAPSFRWLPPLLHEDAGRLTSPSAGQDRHADEVVTPASI
jgi:hypothetical protein